MTRKGRTFEKVIAQLEALTSQANGNVEVKSPDSIPDIHSGEHREVDISLRAKIGTHEILIILECRDRSKKQGTEWIEQLASKRDSVRASKAIAVSSSGYSKPAILKAQFFNIELRTLDKISLQEINSWFRVPSLKSIKYHNDIIRIDFDPKPSISRINLGAKIFWLPETNRSLSFKEIAAFIRDNDPHFFDGLDPFSSENSPIFKLIRKNIFEEPIYLKFDDEIILLRELTFVVKLWSERVEIDPSIPTQYSINGVQISQSVSFEIPVDGKILKLDNHHIIDSGLTYVTADFLSPDADK